MTHTSNSLEIAGIDIPCGTRKKINLPIAKLFDYTELNIPVEVIRGKDDGPILFVSSTIHGDEINGIETIKRLLAHKRLNLKLKGTLIAVPIVNVLGFNNQSRYLPDRRDLNRCFPGSKNGTLGSQTAHILMTEIIKKSTHGIDLHTGAIHRTNLPHIRACLDDPETSRLAKAFNVPVTLHSSVVDGSLRQAAAEIGLPFLLFEGGQALRYEENVIQTALKGILSVMESIGMIEPVFPKKKKMKKTFIAQSSQWIRAPHSGSLRVKKRLGSHVNKNDLLGEISNPYGHEKIKILAPDTGIIIGMTLIPLVNKGNGLFHIAKFENSAAVKESLINYDESLDSDDL